MKKFKSMKSILLTTSLTLGLSLSLASSAFAATYTTVSGDSLYKISQVFNTSITNLVSDNNLTYLLAKKVSVKFDNMIYAY